MCLFCGHRRCRGCLGKWQVQQLRFTTVRGLSDDESAEVLANLAGIADCPVAAWEDPAPLISVDEPRVVVQRVVRAARRMGAVVLDDVHVGACEGGVRAWGHGAQVLRGRGRGRVQLLRERLLRGTRQRHRPDVVAREIVCIHLMVGQP